MTFEELADRAADEAAWEGPVTPEQIAMHEILLEVVACLSAENGREETAKILRAFADSLEVKIGR
jgi:hypothetical protein